MTDPAPRRRLSSDARRAEIATAARPLFARNGYNATTTRQVARAAGVSDALLYRHFDGKQKLLEYVIDEALRTFQSMPPLAALSALPADQLLQRLGAGFLGRVTDNLDLITLMIGEHAEVKDERFVRFIDGAASALGHELAARGASADAEAGYLVARSFFGSLISFVILQRILGMDDVHPITAEAYVGSLVALSLGPR